MVADDELRRLGGLLGSRNGGMYVYAVTTDTNGGTLDVYATREAVRASYQDEISAEPPRTAVTQWTRLDALLDNAERAPGYPVERSKGEHLWYVRLQGLEEQS